MMTDMNCLSGKRLVFLISQPRAGSTLLQRILACHPEIHTASEPWLMLHPLYALRRTAHHAEFDAGLASEALQGFLSELPAGEETYYESVRLAAWHLYSQSLEAAQARYFLDKTPRYFLILPELLRTFPKARFILLLRNPLAVLASVLRTWVGDEPQLLARFGQDLLDAPQLLAEGADQLGANHIVVHYERLVSEPHEVVPEICRHLDVDFLPEMIDYGEHELPRWQFGDQQQVYGHGKPVAQKKEAWQSALETPQIWRFAHDYLRLIPSNVLSRLGYDREQLISILDDHRPNGEQLSTTMNLAPAMGVDPSQLPVDELVHRVQRAEQRVREANERHVLDREQTAQTEEAIDELRQEVDRMLASSTYRRIRRVLPRVRKFVAAVRSTLDAA